MSHFLVILFAGAIAFIGGVFLGVSIIGLAFYVVLVMLVVLLISLSIGEAQRTHNGGYRLPHHWWQRMNPHSSRLCEVLREESDTSKEAFLVHPFHWAWYIVILGAFLVLMIPATTLLWHHWVTNTLTNLAIVLIFAYYFAAIRRTRSVNVAVQRDEEDLTGAILLPGRAWGWPHYDNDLIDMRPRRTVHEFLVTLRNNLTLRVRQTTKWKPNVRSITADGELKFYGQGQAAIEQSVIEQAAELQAALSKLDDLQFNNMRTAAALLHTCHMQVERDLLPHYDKRPVSADLPEGGFLLRKAVVFPKGCKPGESIPEGKRIEFYYVNRELILEELDPIPGDEQAEEGAIGETISWLEGNHGIEVESTAFEGNLDTASADEAKNRFVASLVKQLTSGRMVKGVLKPGLSENAALAIVKRSTHVTSTGGGLMATIIEKGAA